MNWNILFFYLCGQIQIICGINIKISLELKHGNAFLSNRLKLKIEEYSNYIKGIPPIQ